MQMNAQRAYGDQSVNNNNTRKHSLVPVGIVHTPKSGSNLNKFDENDANLYVCQS